MQRADGAIRDSAQRQAELSGGGGQVVVLGLGAVRPVLDPDRNTVKVDDRGAAGERGTANGGAPDSQRAGFGEDEFAERRGVLRAGQDVQHVRGPPFFITAGVTQASSAPTASARLMT